MAKTVLTPIVEASEPSALPMPPPMPKFSNHTPIISPTSRGGMIEVTMERPIGWSGISATDMAITATTTTTRAALAGPSACIAARTSTSSPAASRKSAIANLTGADGFRPRLASPSQSSAAKGASRMMTMGLIAVIQSVGTSKPETTRSTSCSMNRPTRPSSCRWFALNTTANAVINRIAATRFRMSVGLVLPWTRAATTGAGLGATGNRLTVV